MVAVSTSAKAAAATNRRTAGGTKCSDPNAPIGKPLSESIRSSSMRCIHWRTLGSVKFRRGCRLNSHEEVYVAGRIHQPRACTAPIGAVAISIKGGCQP